MRKNKIAATVAGALVATGAGLALTTTSSEGPVQQAACLPDPVYQHLKLCVV